MEIGMECILPLVFDQGTVLKREAESAIKMGDSLSETARFQPGGPQQSRCDER